jgi:hypothetical protein
MEVIIVFIVHVLCFRVSLVSMYRSSEQSHSCQTRKRFSLS